ncbi:MAG: hypothetical protein AB7O26_13030 [Planctomycetaceae bacterium]
MKKFALSIAALCGLGFASVGTAEAGHYHNGHRHASVVVKKYDPFCATPVYGNSYNNRWNDGCFPTVIRREPVYGHNHNYNWNDRYDYRRPVGPSKGFGLTTPDVGFWYGR